mmetsp:Transcript_453/g.1361  ORF Transcript_453/g.1361 Transcript_453/m.1361 type:complete len:230 (-) Transcript_453:97-786(-)
MPSWRTKYRCNDNHQAGRECTGRSGGPSQAPISECINSVVIVLSLDRRCAHMGTRHLHHDNTIARCGRAPVGGGREAHVDGHHHQGTEVVIVRADGYCAGQAQPAEGGIAGADGRHAQHYPAIGIPARCRGEGPPRRGGGKANHRAQGGAGKIAGRTFQAEGTPRGRDIGIAGLHRTEQGRTGEAQGGHGGADDGPGQVLRRMSVQLQWAANELRVEEGLFDGTARGYP